jgi:hypothetical protein
VHAFRRTTGNAISPLSYVSFVVYCFFSSVD